jgi:hypothetical protein
MAVSEATTGARRTPVTLPATATVGLCAMALAAGVWVVSGPLLGTDLVVGKGDNRLTVGLAAVLVVSGLAAVFAGISRLLLARVRRGPLVWNVLAAVVLVLSLAGPAGAATAGAWLALTCLHLVVGLTLILGLEWATRRVRSA